MTKGSLKPDSNAGPRDSKARLLPPCKAWLPDKRERGYFPIYSLESRLETNIFITVIYPVPTNNKIFFKKKTGGLRCAYILELDSNVDPRYFKAGLIPLRQPGAASYKMLKIRPFMCTDSKN